MYRQENLGTGYRCVYECAGVCKIRARVCFVVVGSCYKAIVITNHDKKSIGSVSVSVCGELGGTRA